MVGQQARRGVMDWQCMAASRGRLGGAEMRLGGHRHTLAGIQKQPLTWETLSDPASMCCMGSNLAKEVCAGPARHAVGHQQRVGLGTYRLTELQMVVGLHLLFCRAPAVYVLRGQCASC